MSIAVADLTDDDIREFRDSLPMVSPGEFRSGGRANSPARWHRICHAALIAANATLERQAICDEINRRILDDRGYGYTPPVS